MSHRTHTQVEAATKEMASASDSEDLIPSVDTVTELVDALIKVLSIPTTGETQDSQEDNAGDRISRLREDRSFMFLLK